MTRAITWPHGGSDAGAAVADTSDGQPVPAGALALLVPPQAYPFASGSVQTNRYGVAALVTIWGGTVSAISVQGVQGSVTNGTLIVPAGDTFAVTYTAAPFWTVYLVS